MYDKHERIIEDVQGCDKIIRKNAFDQQTLESEINSFQLKKEKAKERIISLQNEVQSVAVANTSLRAATTSRHSRELKQLEDQLRSARLEKGSKLESLNIQKAKVDDDLARLPLIREFSLYSISCPPWQLGFSVELLLFVFNFFVQGRTEET